MRRFFTFDNLLLSIWYVLILLVIYGQARKLEFYFAPFLVAISFIINSKYTIKVKSNIIYCITAFICITIISSLNWFYLLEPQNYNYIQYLCYSICAYLVSISAYSIMKQKIIHKDLNFIKLLIVLFFVIGIERFFNFYVKVTSVQDFMQLNGFYYILMPLPLIFLVCKSKIRITSFVVSAILCILSAKRSALISIILIGVAIFVLTYKRNKMAFIYLGALFFVLCLCLVDNMEFFERMIKLVERMENISEDGGSGRLSIVNRFFDKDINDIKQMPELFFGNGFESYSIKYNKTLKASHNDFLEIIYSYGIIGLINLIIFYMLLIRRFLWSIRFKDKKYILPCYSALMLFIVYGLVGNNFYFFYLSLPLFMYLGFSEAIYENC